MLNSQKKYLDIYKQNKQCCRSNCYAPLSHLDLAMEIYFASDAIWRRVAWEYIFLVNHMSLQICNYLISVMNMGDAIAYFTTHWLMRATYDIVLISGQYFRL